MDKNQECKKTEQLDPDSRNLIALKKVSEKLGEVSKSLKGCQEVTDRLVLIVNAVSKSYALQVVKGIDERLLHSKLE
jgi:hypothetical protein